MYNLSELIKTDCCIDCGTNEKLREMVGKLNMPHDRAQAMMPMKDTDIYLNIFKGSFATYTGKPWQNPIPLTSINIDL